MEQLQWVLSAFGDEIDADLKVQLKTLTEHNIHHLEIRSVWGKNILELWDGEIEQVRKDLIGNGCAISAIGSPIGKVDIESDFNEHLKQFARVLEIAELLETQFVRMFSFFIKPGQHNIYRERVVNQLGQLTHLAEQRGIILLHENEKDIYGDTAERCLDILETINSPNLRATFDSANFIQVGEEPFPKAYQMLRPWVEYIHIKDALFATGEVKPAGEGDGSYDEFIESLIADQYEGFLSIEPHLDNSQPGGGKARFTEAHTALMQLVKAHSEVTVY